MWDTGRNLKVRDFWAASSYFKVHALCPAELPWHSQWGARDSSLRASEPWGVTASDTGKGEVSEKCSWFSKNLFQVFSTMAWKLRTLAISDSVLSQSSSNLRGRITWEIVTYADSWTPLPETLHMDHVAWAEHRSLAFQLCSVVQ